MAGEGTSIIRNGALVLHVDDETLSLRYIGNMGSSMSNVDKAMLELGLFKLADMRSLPSFCEEGTPDCLYSASVLLRDLPTRMEDRLGTLWHKMSIGTGGADAISSGNASDEGRTTKSSRNHVESSDDATCVHNAPRPDGATATGETVELLEQISSVVQAMRDTPTLATADPRFWVVQQRRWRDVPEGHGGEMRVWNAGSLALMTPEDFASDWLEMEMGKWDDEKRDGDIRLGSSVTMRLHDGGDWENVDDWEVSEIDPDALRDDIDEGVTPPGNEVVWRDWEWETVENTLFLTLEECEEHIRLNAYHYDHPRSFCMHAWRAPQVKTLWHALKAIDWDNLAAVVSSK